MTTSTTAPTAPATSRAPGTSRAVAVLLPLLAAVSTFGMVMFGFVWNDDPVGLGLVFAVAHAAAALTAVVSLPSLLRGERTGWQLVTAWAVAYSYWSVYKVFGEEEVESWPFLTVGLVITALLLSAPTRRHVER